MISYAPISAIVMRHIRMWRRDPNFLLGAFYWPFLDILIWGFLGSWIERTNTAQFQNYGTTALLGVLLWQIIGRGSNVMLTTFNEEIWSYNIVNLFSLPLHIGSWICGSIIFSAIMATLTAAISIVTIMALYDIAMWNLITTFCIFSFPLFCAAVWLAFSCLSLIVTFGKRSVELGYVFTWFFMPFSGAYYPIDVLPRWGQALSSWLPMSYIFTGMRAYVTHQQDPTSYLITGTVMGILYAACALVLFVYCFNRSKRYGLARLPD